MAPLRTLKRVVGSKGEEGRERNLKRRISFKSYCNELSYVSVGLAFLLWLSRHVVGSAAAVLLADLPLPPSHHPTIPPSHL